jgi:hypothetical protein
MVREASELDACVMDGCDSKQVDKGLRSSCKFAANMSWSENCQS